MTTYWPQVALVVSLLGRIPSTPKDQVVSPGYTLEVTSVGRRTVTEVRLTRGTAG